MTGHAPLRQSSAPRDVTAKPKTTAQRQAAYRRRRADRIAELEAEVARLRALLGQPLTDAEKLADALRMARQFLGLAIPGSQNCAATVVDEALAQYERNRRV